MGEGANNVCFWRGGGCITLCLMLTCKALLGLLDYYLYNVKQRVIPYLKQFQLRHIYLFLYPSPPPHNISPIVTIIKKLQDTFFVMSCNNRLCTITASVVACQRYFGSCMPVIFMSLCNSHDYERLYFQKSIIENCFIEPY